MTVVALYRGKPKSCNAMVVDTVCSFRERPSETAYWTDKLFLVFGNTYATVVGEADAANALRIVVNSLDPKRPNLKSPEIIDATLSTLERLWALRERTTGKKPHGSKGTIFFFCTRTDVFYWVAGYDEEARRFERPSAPRLVGEGEGIIFWGSDPFPIARRELDKLGETLMAEPFEFLVAMVVRVDNIARAQGKTGLLYPLDGPFSGVVLPHKTSNPLKRIHPFSLPELLARASGPDHLELLQDADFMAYKPPPAQ